MRYALTIFSSAFLLFLVQPLISKAILPWFGGSPALWTTAMLFFQALLLLGYAYAHASTRCLPPRAQAALHLALVGVALTTLPILPDPAWQPEGEEEPTVRVLAILAATVGLPYFLLAGTGPLVQAWYAREHGGRPPYRLYALSNVASFLALVAYPFALQPHLDLAGQARLWSWGYGLFALAGVWCAAVAVRAAGDARPVGGEARVDAAPPPLGDRVLWVLLPACACVLLLAVTNHLCQDVATVPFLWVLPLALYLLSFVLAFERDGWYRRAWWTPVLAVTLAGAAAVLQPADDLLTSPLGDVRVQAALLGAALLVACVVCHGELARLKPAAEHATTFYLSLAAGGALGGALVALGAPLVFDDFLELPLGLVACVLLAGLAWWRDPAGLPRREPRRARACALLGLAGLVALAGYLAEQYAARRAGALLTSRNFYGVLRLEERFPATTAQLRLLRHGNVLHGGQLVNDPQGPRPLFYYGPRTGIGRLLRGLGERRERLRVGVLGLGVGALAAYGRPDDSYRFYELDPAVVDAARAEFDFLRSCEARWEVEVGDGRLSLAREAPRGFDLLVLDAFSSDAIPVHLLTEEAFDIYLRHLRPDGLLAVHVTNRSLDLAQVVAREAAERGLAGTVVRSRKDGASLQYRSRWMVLARDPQLLDALGEGPRSPLPRPHARRWTDAYSSILPLLRPRGPRR